MRPMEKALNTQPSGTLFTMAMNVFMSGGAPHGMPMHICTMTGSSMSPASTRLLACHRCPVSNTSISGRTPSS